MLELRVTSFAFLFLTKYLQVILFPHIADICIFLDPEWRHTMSPILNLLVITSGLSISFFLIRTLMYKKNINY